MHVSTFFYECSKVGDKPNESIYMYAGGAVCVWGITVAKRKNVCNWGCVWSGHRKRDEDIDQHSEQVVLHFFQYGLVETGQGQSLSTSAQPSNGFTPTISEIF